MGLIDGVVNALGGVSGMEEGCVQLASAFGNSSVQDLVAKFQASGLDVVVQSWVSSGANLPVSAEQVHAVLGSDTVRNIAGALKIDPAQVPAVLPDIVNHMTPGGAVPDGGMADILQKLGGTGTLGALVNGLLKGA